MPTTWDNYSLFKRRKTTLSRSSNNWLLIKINNFHNIIDLLATGNKESEEGRRSYTPITAFSK